MAKILGRSTNKEKKTIEVNLPSVLPVGNQEL